MSTPGPDSDVSPFSPVVLGVAGLVSAPALWQCLAEKSMPVDTAVLRFLVAWVAVWGALWLVQALIGPAPRQAEVEESEHAER